MTSPSPKDSQWIRTPSRSTKPLSSGSRARIATCRSRSDETGLRRRGSPRRSVAGWPGSGNWWRSKPSSSSASEPMNTLPINVATSAGSNGPRPPRRSAASVATSVSSSIPADQHVAGGVGDRRIAPPGGDHLLQHPHEAALEIVLEEVAGLFVAAPQRHVLRRTSGSGGRTGDGSRTRARRAPSHPWSRSGSGPGTAGRRPPAPPCASTGRRSRRSAAERAPPGGSPSRSRTPVAVRLHPAPSRWSVDRMQSDHDPSANVNNPIDSAGRDRGTIRSIDRTKRGGADRGHGDRARRSSASSGPSPAAPASASARRTR